MEPEGVELPTTPVKPEEKGTFLVGDGKDDALRAPPEMNPFSVLLDPEFQRVAAAWAKLPRALREAILAIVASQS